MKLLNVLVVVIGRLLWVLAGFGSLAGGVQLSLVGGAAPQAAAEAALAVGYAVIPYTLARAWDHLVLTPVRD